MKFSHGKDEYRVVTLIPADSKVEQLGSKKKFWFQIENSLQPYLFKYPRADTGEHWAEKIAAEIAKVINLPAAEVELAEFKGNAGVIVKSFLSHEPEHGKWPRLLSELIHGNEVLGGQVLGYDKNKKWGQSDHSWQNIKSALKNKFGKENYSRELKCFAGFIIFDALIGNTDRHHENWGLHKLYNPKPGTPALTLAPSFDHASSLGREITEEKRKKILDSNSIGTYVERGRGGIYWEGQGKHGENPLNLVRLAAEDEPDAFQPWIKSLRNCAKDDIMAPVDRITQNWMSDNARDFCREFLTYTFQELKGINV